MIAPRLTFALASLSLFACGTSDSGPVASGNAGGMVLAGAGGTASSTGGGAGKGGGGAAGNGAAGTSVTGGSAGTGGASATGGAGVGGGGGFAGATAGKGGGGASATGGSASAGKGGTAGASAGKGGAAGAAGGSGGTAGGGVAGSGGSGTATICQGVASASFEPPTNCNGPSGNTTKQVPSNHVYSTSWFGCYKKPDGTIFQDPTDNCQFACGSKGLCPAGQSGPDCEANLKWFSADADRYGCGARIRLTNCVNGKQVVVAALDRGPNCPTEKSFGVPVIDMSHDAMIYLFDGKEYGGSDKKRIVVEPVDMATPLGPG